MQVPEVQIYLIGTYTSTAISDYSCSSVGDTLADWVKKTEMQMPELRKLRISLGYS